MLRLCALWHQVTGPNNGVENPTLNPVSRILEVIFAGVVSHVVAPISFLYRYMMTHSPPALISCGADRLAHSWSVRVELTNCVPAAHFLQPHLG